MLPVSLVIIAKNEAHIIGQTLAALRPVVGELLVADTGSTDDTIDLAVAHGARVIHLPWQGFGWCKQQAALAARYDWVLALDADEVPDADLIAALQQIDLAAIDTVYRCRFLNYIGQQLLLHGEWKPFYKVRLFNRQHCNWNDAIVHETIALPTGTRQATLKGHILHYTSRSLREYAEKMTVYAHNMAAKYHAAGKRPSFFKLYAYYPILFFQTWVLKGGFRDGRLGYACAKIVAHCGMLKYHLLAEMRKGRL
jgi:glycosyltransferase involved in cell wall biosynthesis